jgi:hypothetical protein
MNDPLEDQTLTEFVLESETHIDAAARMARIFPLVQRRIILPILDALEKKLREWLGADWEIHNCRDEILVANYPGFVVSRKSWGEIYVNFESQTREGGTVVGVWRKREPRLAALDSALADAFAKADLSGDANSFWAWVRYLPAEFGDWNAAPALAAMQFHQEETADYFADQILMVHRVAAPVIDAFTTKKGKLQT